MISRQWRGLARRESAAHYIEHLETETFPSIAKLAGFVDASILKRNVPRGVEFLIVTRWRTLDSIRAFAGNDVETAVVPDKVQAMMLEYDRVVRHYEIVDAAHVDA
jgi:heme-degrading monooxygenase HmoA